MPEPEESIPTRPLTGEAFTSLEEAIAAIEDQSVYRVRLDESERQMILLGLHKVRQERPGWDHALGQIERKLGGQIKWPE